MKGLAFELSGKTAFFKKPDVNSFAYFTYNNIHKVALLGMFGAIIGLKGYSQREISNNRDEFNHPEFYEKLKDLKVSVVPISKKGYFSKKIQVFNNSVGYASKEQGGNLIVREQWIENPKWEIFILNDSSIENEIFDKLSEGIINNKCEFIPYLGKNDHIANINKTREIEMEKVEDVEFLSSLFPINKVKLDDDLTYDDNNPYLFIESLPISLNNQYQFYEFMELGFTNLEVEDIYDLDNIYRYGDKILYFI